MKKTALLSVYYKDGIVAFAQALVARGWEILASGGTARALRGAKVPVRDVGENGQLIGNGVGQQDRVGCCELAIKRAHDAGHRTEGAVAYSDSFFPFSDGPEVLALAGIGAILTSSGSRKDDEVKAMCDKYGVVLVMVPDAVGRGFCNH